MANLDYTQVLNTIMEKTTLALKESKQEIYDLARDAEEEKQLLQKELDNVQERINVIIEKVDELERKNRRARKRLVEVNKKTVRSSEYEMKDAYEHAERILLELVVEREKEEHLKKRRQELQLRLRNLDQTVQKVENLGSKVSVVQDYLCGNLAKLNQHIQDLHLYKDMGIQILQAQEKERKRVAREIHDGLAQSIANLIFRIEYCEEMLEKDTETAREEIINLKEIGKDSLQAVRKIIFDLRPMALDDLGLVPAIRNYIKKYEEQTGIFVSLVVIGDEGEIGESVSITIYRIVQEALNNVHKHAGVARANLKLEFVDDLINVVIKDEGTGFDMEQIKEEQKEGARFGLVSLKERAEVVGGQLKIDATPGVGTKIYVQVPRGGNFNER
ncbi:MAG: sensor histidine kinase [Halanaerobium sp.]|nr:sensor histidine kinase [Halanaerobium sp.]